jgi:hypothetical protein
VPATQLWTFGWSLVLLGFSSGALLGLGFHREAFLGGYGSFRRRLVRLGHVACVMLGILQMLVALSPAAASTGPLAGACAAAWIAGALAMPLVCFLAAWRPGMRRWFPLPVACLITAASLTLALLSKGSPS